MQQERVTEILHPKAVAEEYLNRTTYKANHPVRNVVSNYRRILLHFSSRFVFVLISIHGLHVYPQTNSFKFSRITGIPFTENIASTGGISLVDIDEDGRMDVFVTHGYDVSKSNAPAQGNRLYTQLNGNWQTVLNAALVRDSSYSSGSAWADYDNDGDLDVYVTNQTNKGNFLFENKGNRQFARSSASGLEIKANSFSSAWVDVDNDGWLDIHVANGGLSGRVPGLLFRNKKNGSFEEIKIQGLTTDSLATAGAAWADFDLDGDMDVFLPEVRGRNSFYRNDGNFAFSKIENLLPTYGYGCLGATWGDIDNDGDLDIFLPTRGGYADYLYINENNGRFRALQNDISTLEPGHSFVSQFADLDNDGDLDLIVGNWGGIIQLYSNNGKGRFSRVIPSAFYVMGYSSSLALGDYDNDGDLDIFFGNWSDNTDEKDKDFLFRNELKTGKWMMIELEGAQTNRSAVGSRVVVEAMISGRLVRQTRFVTTHPTWRSQNQQALHFGLGNAQNIKSVRVYWPSGKMQEFFNIRVNKKYHVTEGQELK